VYIGGLTVTVSGTGYPVSGTVFCHKEETMADRMKMYDILEAFLESSKADPHFDDYYHFVLNRIMQRFKKYPESDDCDIDIWVNEEGKIIVQPIIATVKYKPFVITKETVDKLQREEDDDSYFKRI
jgi:hypothetical protein